MSSRISIIAIVSIVAILAYLGYSRFYKEVATPTPYHTNSNSTSSTNFDRVFISDSTYALQSKVLGFRFELPSAVSYTNNVQLSGGELLRIDFQEENVNTSEVPNRETPNKINTSAYDTFSLQIFSNTNSLNKSDVTAFQAWRKSMGIGDAKDQTIQIEVGADRVWRCIQSDGIGSQGYYYYYISDTRIYVIGTSDISDQTMRTLLMGFSIV